MYRQWCPGAHTTEGGGEGGHFGFGGEDELVNDGVGPGEDVWSRAVVTVSRWWEQAAAVWAGVCMR
eukprot:1517570-Prymnesium_polylepis.2